jgi:hypothetical protein
MEEVKGQMDFSCQGRWPVSHTPWLLRLEFYRYKDWRSGLRLLWLSYSYSFNVQTDLGSLRFRGRLLYLRHDGQKVPNVKVADRTRICNGVPYPLGP